MELEGERWSLSTACEWVQFLRFRQWSWIDFTWALASTEWDRRLGTVRVEAGLLGFRARVSYTYDPDTPFRAELAKMIDLSEAMVCVPFDEYEALLADANKWRGVPVESLGREHAP